MIPAPPWVWPAGTRSIYLSAAFYWHGEVSWFCNNASRDEFHPGLATFRSPYHPYALGQLEYVELSESAHKEIAALIQRCHAAATDKPAEATASRTAP